MGERERQREGRFFSSTFPFVFIRKATLFMLRVPRTALEDEETKKEKNSTSISFCCYTDIHF